MADDGIIIIGGGLAGLAASIETGAPVYEAAGEIGGKSGADKQDGFVFDRGIHVLQTKNKTIVKLFEEIGLKLVDRVRNAHIYSRNTYTSYPFQVNTAGLPIALRVECVWSYLRRGKNPKPTNYKEWIYRGIGRGFGDNFLIPYSEKFWTVDTADMGFDWTGNRVPSTSMWQVLRGALWSKRTDAGTNARFQYPENGSGFGSLPQALSQRAGKIHVNHRMTKLDMANKKVEFNGEFDVPYEHLITTVPLPDLIPMIPDAPDEIREAASKLHANSIMVVNFGIDRANISDKHWVHFPEKEICFFRLSFPHNFTETVTPSGKSSVSVEVAYSKKRPLDLSTLYDDVRRDLIKVGVLRADDKILTRCMSDIRYGYCIYDKDRKPAVRKIKQWLAERDVTTAGRYGLWAYFWSHEAILNGLNTGRAVLRKRAKQTASARADC